MLDNETTPVLPRRRSTFYVPLTDTSSEPRRPIRSTRSSPQPIVATTRILDVPVQPIKVSARLLTTPKPQEVTRTPPKQSVPVAAAATALNLVRRTSSTKLPRPSASTALLAAARRRSSPSTSASPSPTPSGSSVASAASSPAPLSNCHVQNSAEARIAEEDDEDTGIHSGEWSGAIAFADYSIVVAFAVRCYECNSKDNPDCAKDIPGKTLEKDCSEHVEGSKYTMCRKILQSIDFEVNGLQPNSRVIRGCAWEDDQYKNRCYQRSGFGGRQEVCACTGDLCNSSGRPTASWALAGVAALVTAAAAAVVV